MKQRIHQIELFMKYPEEVQREWLKKLLQLARNTQYGREYGFESIASAEEFRKRVPLNDYESMKPYIERLRNGEQNLLWASEIRWFAKSSGTTSDKSKFIPVSQETLEECHLKGGKDMLSIFCNNYPDTLLFNGKSIAMGGTDTINEVNNDWYYEGDLSAIIIRNLPFWAELRRTPELSIALMNEWESKIGKMAEATLQHNVTSISGVPSWTLLLLKRILEITGKEHMLEVWPEFEVFFHGGVSFQPYRQQFAGLFPSSSIHYLETYNASEGFFGIQDRTDTEDLLLMLDYGIYYEFLPMNCLDQPDGKTLLIGEVELYTNYALLITTNSGLWRYMLGDTIEFTSRNPYRFRITGRTRHFINAFGEEVIVDNAERALATACARTHAVINEYTAAPVYFEKNRNGAHEWLIEFEQLPSDIALFADVLDNALKSLNSDYEAKRYRGMILGEPIVKALPRGTFYRWMKIRGKLGGQNKVPRLSNNRKYVEELLNLNLSLTDQKNKS